MYPAAWPVAAVDPHLHVPPVLCGQPRGDAAHYGCRGPRAGLPRGGLGGPAGCAGECDEVCPPGGPHRPGGTGLWQRTADAEPPGNAVFGFFNGEIDESTAAVCDGYEKTECGTANGVAIARREELLFEKKRA